MLSSFDGWPQIGHLRISMRGASRILQHSTAVHTGALQTTCDEDQLFILFYF